MRFPKGHKCHECAPQEWRRTPDITGSYELDAVIHKNGNKDLPHRLAYFCESTTNNYGPRTGYNGYHGYSGDD
jgi:hypothetical protein